MDFVFGVWILCLVFVCVWILSLADVWVPVGCVYSVSTFDSANWPNVAPCRGSSQWSSPCEGNNKEVGCGVRVECAEEVTQGNNNDHA